MTFIDQIIQGFLFTLGAAIFFIVAFASGILDGF